MSGAGDVNGDGCDDVAVGALRVSAFNAGAAYVIFGKKDREDTIVATKLLSARAGAAILGTSWSWFGYSVSGAGDVNGDGFDDLMVGSTPKKVRAEPPSSVIVYGKAGFASPFAYSSLIPGGVVVHGLGDVNGDKLADVMAVSDVDLTFGAGLTVVLPSVVSNPTHAPTFSPTVLPTVPPTFLPSVWPAIDPSCLPTETPTQPTQEPTEAPSGPTLLPTGLPSQPTSGPSNHPTAPTRARPSLQRSRAPRPAHPESTDAVRAAGAFPSGARRRLC